MTTKFKILSIQDISAITQLTKLLNPNVSLKTLETRQTEMFTYSNYRCFGLFKNDVLIGISSGWITTKLYSGKQLEIDNVIVDSKHQSKGYGALFINYIEDWAKQHSCLSVELNTYTQNTRSHKFYYNKGYDIIGFHFEKEI